MSVDEHPPISLPSLPDPPPEQPGRTAQRLELGRPGTRRTHRRMPRLPRRAPRLSRRPRVRKLRLLLLLGTFGVLALVSTLFGMLTAVASDLPQLENRAQYQHAVNSYLYDDTGRPIGTLAPPNAKVIDNWQQISQNMVHAIVSVEDKRFWTDPGVDLRGIARAFVSDITGGPREGASTIPEQFVKNALAEQDNRTIFEKLREAALAFQLTHHWKRLKILTEYLNTIYFGNGAYGIESAARVYFGRQLGFEDSTDPSKNGCGDPDAQNPNRIACARKLDPAQAALLAGMVANPTEFDPVLHPRAAWGRRQLVLQDMRAQHYITAAEYARAVNAPLPKATDIQQPTEPAAAPYFTSWVRPQIIAALEHEGVSAKLAPYEAYYGGLKIRLTINLKLQAAAQQAVDAEFPPGSKGPTADLVAIDNRNGEVRAMVSGDGDYEADPFNLATEGERQPGSSFKLFTLAQALSTGAYGPDSIIDSAPQDIPFRTSHGIAHFIVHNFDNAYSGPITLSAATAASDNSVFAQVGMHVGTKNIARMAHRMGIRTPISTNPAMIIGGLRTGVSALDMAHAYETAATGGEKVYNPTLGDVDEGPIGIHSIASCALCRSADIVNRPDRLRIISPEVAATIHEMLAGVVAPGGTGTAAAIPGVDVVGKTGTTSNYVDAWFVGWTPQMTVAVWVGYPNSATPMLTNYDGGPVEGGTFPAVIWHNFMEQALQILGTGTTSASTGATGVLPGSVAAGTSGSTTAAGTTGASTVTTGGTTGQATPGAPATGSTGTTGAAGTTGTGRTDGTTGAGGGTTGTAPGGTTGAGTSGAGSGGGGGGTTGSGGAGVGG